MVSVIEGPREADLVLLMLLQRDLGDTEHALWRSGAQQSWVVSGDPDSGVRLYLAHLTYVLTVLL